MKYSLLGLQITNKCNLNCSHCITSSYSKLSDLINFDNIKKTVHDSANLGIDKLCISGGEPFLYLDHCKSILNLAKNNNIHCSIITNGYWGKSRNFANDTLDELQKNGLKSLGISSF